MPPRLCSADQRLKSWRLILTSKPNIGHHCDYAQCAVFFIIIEYFLNIKPRRHISKSSIGRDALITRPLMPPSLCSADQRWKSWRLILTSEPNIGHHCDYAQCSVVQCVIVAFLLYILIILRQQNMISKQLKVSLLSGWRLYNLEFCHYLLADVSIYWQMPL